MTLEQLPPATVPAAFTEYPRVPCTFVFGGLELLLDEVFDELSAARTQCEPAQPELRFSATPQEGLGVPR